MTVDIWSDVMCPWCAIGYAQLAKALDQLDGEIEALVRWHPFELNSDMPPEGEDQALHIQRKYRRTAEEGVAVRAQMRSIAEGAGVSLDYEGARRSEEHTSELQSLMRISYAVFCLQK